MRSLILAGGLTQRDLLTAEIHRELLQRTGMPQIQEGHVEEALKTLERDGTVQALDGGGRWALRQFDVPESDLYQPIFEQLPTSNAGCDLGLSSPSRVGKRTAEGGPAFGRYSVPDLLFAVIQSWKFDPQRTLDVFSVEIKNRKGTNVTAVYEALGQGRFVHYPVLVVPRSPVEAPMIDQVEHACEREGVGLVLFNLLPGMDGARLRITDLQTVVLPQRRVTAPRDVERFLTYQLSKNERDRLEALARAK